jgi:hypothetical protein
VNTKSFANGNGSTMANGPILPLHLKHLPELAMAWEFREHQLLGI